jgi:hypothetical protein
MNLVRMRDAETLYELMTEDEDWMTQLEAAEGLVKLGDRRGYEFLMTATMSDDEEILEVAQEIIDSPTSHECARRSKRNKGASRTSVCGRRKEALQRGGRVFRYKMVYVPASALMEDDPLSEGFDHPALEEHGLTGWEIVHMIPSRRNSLVGSVEAITSRARTFLLKKEVLAGEANDLRELKRSRRFQKPAQVNWRFTCA